MLNRRILRIKVFKTLYGCELKENSSLAEAEAQFDASCEATRDLYLFMLGIVSPLTKIAAEKIEAARKKFNPTEEERNPNTRFADNALAKLLDEDPDFQKIFKKRKFSWEQYDLFLKKVFNSVSSKEYYSKYMQSENNPKIGQYQRISGLEHKCDGAAAAILCATDLVEKYTKNTPIEILGIGNACLEYSNPRLEITCTYEAARQVSNLTGVKPEEIDLLYANDFIISSQLLAAEAIGYIPDKESWKYVLDNRTAFNGDKPINPNGGRCAFGHAHAASGLADVYDSVLQMRGKAGDHQINKIPKTVYLRGYGGGQNICNIILRTKENQKGE